MQRVKCVVLPQGLCDPQVTNYTKAIIQQLNCVSTKGARLAAAVEEKYPHAMRYHQRRQQSHRKNYAIAEDWDVPGSISVHPPVSKEQPTIINLYAQFDMGKPCHQQPFAFPPGVYDSTQQRKQWFWQGLQQITTMKQCPKSLAFTD